MLPSPHMMSWPENTSQLAATQCHSLQKNRTKESKRASRLNESKNSRLLRHSVVNMRFTSPVSKDFFSRASRVRGSEGSVTKKADHVEIIRSLSQAGWQSKPPKNCQNPTVSSNETTVSENPPMLKLPEIDEEDWSELQLGQSKLPKVESTSMVTLNETPGSEHPPTLELPGFGQADWSGLQLGNLVEVYALSEDGQRPGTQNEKYDGVVVTSSVHVNRESSTAEPTGTSGPERSASKKSRPRISLAIPKSRALSFRRVRQGDSLHYEKDHEGEDDGEPFNSTATSPTVEINVVPPKSAELPAVERPFIPRPRSARSYENEQSSVSTGGDTSSCYSDQSSMSSCPAPPNDEKVSSPDPSDVVEFSIMSPADAGVFDEPYPAHPKAPTLKRTNLTLSFLNRKPLPPEPVIEIAPLLVGGKPCSSAPSNRTSHRKSISEPPRISQISPIPFTSRHSLRGRVDLDTLDAEFLKSSPLYFRPEELIVSSPSPTMDEVADELEDQLSAIKDSPSFPSDDVSVPLTDLSTDELISLSRASSGRMPSRTPPLHLATDASKSPQSERPRRRERKEPIFSIPGQVSDIPGNESSQQSAPAPVPAPMGKKPSIACRRATGPTLETVPESALESLEMERGLSSNSSTTSSVGDSVFTDASAQGTEGSERYPSGDELKTLPNQRPRLRRNPPRTPRPRSSEILANSGIPFHSSTTFLEAQDPQSELTGVISADAAEKIILQIMSHLETLQDLFTCAHLNRGFYSTFKRNEMQLIKDTLFKMSPAAWELREMCPPYEQDKVDSAAPRPEYTPSMYLRNYSGDMYAMIALKSLILQHCSSFLRPQTIVALAGNDDIRSARIDDAFWRVWSFCRIFGCGKNREDDIVGQMDWLKGGVLAYQQEAQSSVAFSSDFALTSVLFNPPEGFAKGNGQGLTTEELYDMLEVWTCLDVLLHGFHGMREEARKAGIFDHTDVNKGDVNAENATIEEWTYHLLNLSPAVVLTLSSTFPFPSPNPTPATFSLATSLELTVWSPPPPGCTRRHFLREAVNRVYEAQILMSPSRFTRSPTAITPSSEHSDDRMLLSQRYQQQRNQRRHTSLLAAELRRSRHAHTYSEPAPNSNPDGHLSVVTALRPSPSISSPEVCHGRQPAVSQPSPQRPSSANSVVSNATFSPHLPSSVTNTPITLVSPHSFSLPQSCRSDAAPDKFSIQRKPLACCTNPRHQPTTDVFQAHFPSSPMPLERSGGESQVIDPVDTALMTLVDEMGFPEDDAKRALSETDRGQAIDLNAAADLLMRESEYRGRRASALTRTPVVNEKWTRTREPSAFMKECGVTMSGTRRPDSSCCRWA